MDVDKAIMGRRSVRKYSDKPVPLESVREVLEAGTWAPSAKNGQQWRFTVLTGSSKKELEVFPSRTRKTIGKDWPDADGIVI